MISLHTLDKMEERLRQAALPDGPKLTPGDLMFFARIVKFARDEIAASRAQVPETLPPNVIVFPRKP